MGNVTAMCALVALLACLILGAAAVPTKPIKTVDSKVIHIPDGKAHVYKYSAVVGAGQNEPASFSSKFEIHGKLIQKKSGINNARYLKFNDVEHTSYNGPNGDEGHNAYHAIDDKLKDLEKPIVAMYDNFYTLQSVKIQEDEVVWSKNMKKSLASLMQVDFKRFEINETLSSMIFKTNEKTIHGTCSVDYSVYTKVKDGKNFYYVRKTYEPKKCSQYVLYFATDGKSMSCNAEPENDLVTAATKVYEFEYIDNNYIIKKIVSYEKHSYLPYLHRSHGIQFIETNQTIEFEKVVDESELQLSAVDFTTIPKTSDLSYDKSDFSQSIVKENVSDKEQRDLIAKVKDQLLTIVDYLQKNQIDMKQIDPKSFNILGDLYLFLSQSNTKTLTYLFNHFNVASEKGNLTRKIFLEFVSHVGSHTAWEFAYDVINDGLLQNEAEAIRLLNNLPMYTRDVSENFTMSMEKLLTFNSDNTSNDVRYAGILSFSILLHETYKNIGKEVPDYLAQQLLYFNERLNYEATYRGKILYIMAMRNIEVGGIYQYLAPMVRGEYNFFVNVDIEKPEKYRMAAMWAVAKSINHNSELTYNLFYPILSNSSLSLPMRVVAYELLVSRNPKLDMNLLMNIHSLMTEEEDPHMFNYHYMTLKHMSESKDPCMSFTSEMMRKVLRLTKRQKNLSAAISTVNVADYYDTKYGFGETFKLGVTFNENSGMPQAGYYETISTSRRRARLNQGYYWNVDGLNLNTLMKFVKKFIDFESTAHEISDEQVKEVLLKTYGHKYFDKHIHVELWILEKGYVTDVQVYFENGLMDLFKKVKDTYKMENLMDAGEKLIFDVLNIYNYNHYRMVTTTSIGLPAYFMTEIPNMIYMKFKPNIYPFKTVITMNLEFDLKYYYQVAYIMKIYNPFTDFMHSVQRRVTTDAALPLEMSVSFNIETRNLKIVLPRNLESNLGIAGVKVHAGDLVVLENDSKNAFKNYCSTCNYVTEVTVDPALKRHHESTVHSADTGLEFMTAVFDCDHDHKLSFEKEELHRIFNSEPNDLDNDVPQLKTILHRQILSIFMNMPYAGTCGTIMKVSPSTVYSTSRIEINLRFNIMAVGTETKLNVRGSMDTKAMSTNQTIRFWDMDGNLDISKFYNSLALKLIKKTPGEKDTKICLGFHKEYPNYLTSAANIKNETKSKMYFLMDQSDGENCSNEEIVVKVVMLGELLDEQVEQIKKNVKPGSCFKNPANPLDLDITQRFDWNCLHEAVKGTTLRKYTIDVQYKKIPHEALAHLIAIEDYFRLDNLARITYKPEHTEAGSIKILNTYSPDYNYGNITVINPFFTYELTDVQYGSDDNEDRHNDLVLDNIGFSNNFLVDYYKGDIRPCIAHANDVITDLNQTVPMDFKHWTLMYGDHTLMMHAVFVKNVDGDKVAVRIYILSHVLEIQPGTKPIVMFNGERIQNYEQGIPLPDAHVVYFRISMVNQMILVDTEKISVVKVYYTPYNVIVHPHILLDRNIDGVCGHMGSTMYKQEVPLILAGDE